MSGEDQSHHNLESTLGDHVRGFYWNISQESPLPALSGELFMPDPMASTQTGTTCNRSNMAEIVQTLLRLQQEMVEFRNATGSSNSSGRNPASSMPSSRQQYPVAFGPVDAVLRPGQELLNMIWRIFDECSKFSKGLVKFFDWRTLYPLVLAPLSLLLSTYGEALREIATAMNRIQTPANLLESSGGQQNHLPFSGSSAPIVGPSRLLPPCSPNA